MSQQAMKHWPGLFDPPNAPPMAELRAIMDRARGIETDNAKAVHAGLTVAMYGNCVLSHGPLIVSPSGSVGEQLDFDSEGCCEDAADRLESLVPDLNGPVGSQTVGAIPWDQILVVVVPLVLEWFRRR